MKFGTILASILGGGLAIWLLVASGIGNIAALLSAGGAGIALVVAFHVVQLAASAAAWRAIASGPQPAQSFGTYVLLRWIREGVNNLLPSGQIGGEFIAAGLLRRRGVKLVDATAGVVGDLTMEMLTQVAFTLFGLALLGLSLAAPDRAVFHKVEVGIAVALLAAACFLGAQLLGGARVVERGLARLSARFGWAGAAELVGLHAALAALWRRPGPVLRAAWWHSLSWLLGAGEVWLALRVLGHPTPLVTSCVIEVIGQALKSAGFAVPGAIGVQEGGYVLVCGLYGIPSDVAIALSLVKRIREIVLGVPSLFVWKRAARQTGTGRTVPGTMGRA